MPKKPSANLIRVRRFRKKAGQSRIEILCDVELKAWFQSLPGESHTDRLRLLRDSWEKVAPPAQPALPGLAESGPDYAALLQQRIVREQQKKYARNHHTDPERSWRKKWREEPHYRAAAEALGRQLGLPELAECMAQGWGPYLLEFECLALAEAPLDHARYLVWLIWQGKHDFQDATELFGGHIPHQLATQLRERKHHYYSLWWKRQHPDL